MEMRQFLLARLSLRVPQTDAVPFLIPSWLGVVSSNDPFPEKLVMRAFWESLDRRRRGCWSLEESRGTQEV